MYRTPKILTLLVTLITLSAAHAQVLSDSLTIDGNSRKFFFNKPPDSFKNPSLIFVLHGSGGNGRDMMQGATKMDERASTENALVVYPSGYKRYWNECRKASFAEANTEDVNEQAFFADMIAYFHKRYAVDRNHVFVVGTSGGGHMAYKLALTMPDAFRAATAIIANLPDSTNLDCTPVGKAIPMLIINGTADPINPYKGGVVNLGPGRSMGAVRSTDRTFAYWANLAGYTGSPTAEKIPDITLTDDQTIERYTYRTTGKPDVILLKVNGGKHEYPHDLDPHLEALSFFERQLRQP
ncbi:MAG: prolyl oligopeptidase family serine peptidase [Spirosoma sp.]|nr:prolyl oligopeptidase family serine peptidase [Spirosoma sp.]